MPRGGARPGAGRKPKIRPPEVLISEISESGVVGLGVEGKLTPLAYLLSVVNDASLPGRDRVQAASIAAPYVHAKKGEGGKKELEAEAAKKAGTGKFAAAAPPKLVAASGRKV